jgi:hypothetical protein
MIQPDPFNYECCGEDSESVHLHRRSHSLRMEEAGSTRFFLAALKSERTSADKKRKYAPSELRRLDRLTGAGTLYHGQSETRNFVICVLGLLCVESYFTSLLLHSSDSENPCSGEEEAQEV